MYTIRDKDGIAVVHHYGHNGVESVLQDLLAQSKLPIAALYYHAQNNAIRTILKYGIDYVPKQAPELPNNISSRPGKFYTEFLRLIRNNEPFMLIYDQANFFLNEKGLFEPKPEIPIRKSLKVLVSHFEQDPLA